MDFEEIREKRIAFLGAGVIAGIFIERLLKGGWTVPKNILATDIRPERLNEVRERWGIEVSGDNRDAALFADILFIAVPPGAVKSVISETASLLRSDQLIVSLAAAVPIGVIERAAGRPIPVVRMIPNTPSLIGKGMNPHCIGKQVAAQYRALVKELLGVFGESIEVEESLMNVATALTAVGPTFVFPLIKVLKEAAVRAGLPEVESQRAAAQMVAGAAQLVFETRLDPDILKTMIGTRTLDEEKAKALFTAAFETALERILASEKKLAA